MRRTPKIEAELRDRLKNVRKLTEEILALIGRSEEATDRIARAELIRAAHSKATDVGVELWHALGDPARR